MQVLAGLNILQLGPGLAAAACGRLFADIGANVARIGADAATPLALHLNHGKPDLGAGPATREAVAAADLIVIEGRPSVLCARQCDPEALRRINPRAAIVAISPFGQAGPHADDPASDLTLLYASGIARMLTGQVDDLAEAPIRPVGRQSALIGGIAAACAGMHAAMAAEPAIVDVSIQEALATIAITELARAGTTGRGWSRKRLTDGNGATVCILPARDGFTAISPRDDHQWAAWLTVMGTPQWGNEPRFATKPDRVANWDALHALMSEWSRHQDKQAIADKAQAAHVPSFPLREPAEQLASAQLDHRGFWRGREIAGRMVKTPGPPFGLAPSKPELNSGRTEPRPRTVMAAPDPAILDPRLKRGDDAPRAMPLAGIRVLDFSWVIAGPTATRYLAAMGAEIIKVEAPGRGDPGRSSELHTVLGQAKRGIVLDLKKPEAIRIARALAAKCDALVENFATGVMDRLGLGAEALREANPDLVYVSASGLGRTGPEGRAVAYGTLLQCYAGFAGLNRHPGIPPRVGLAWLDPMCGLMLAFITAAALWQRRQTGQVARVDFSMLEALLWTMAEPLLAAQLGAAPQPAGNRSETCAPHGAWRCADEDGWVGIAVGNDDEWRRLCTIVPGLTEAGAATVAQRQERGRDIGAALAAWTGARSAATAASALRRSGIAAAPAAAAPDLVADPHLRERGFWEAHPRGVIPGLPWQASFGRVSGPAPALGADTDAVLREVLGLNADDVAALRQARVLG
jgi:crotonobetainyl-CoA:carnitine CoA-transferase CaiB-like acyl-CoA transferase